MPANGASPPLPVENALLDSDEDHEEADAREQSGEREDMLKSGAH
jgi:hypothetical protein